MNDKTLNEVISSLYISKIKELYLQNKPNNNLFYTNDIVGSGYLTLIKTPIGIYILNPIHLNGAL